MNWVERKRLADFVRGDDEQRKGYAPEEAERVWERLEAFAYGVGDEAVVEDVDCRRVTPGVRRLLTYRACTLTGRVRANTIYTDGANAPFSGLAADGAKLAMWNLMRRGFKLLAFVHDSFDVAIDPRQAKSQQKQVEKIMVASMEEVLGHGIPVAVDSSIGDSWTKG